MSKRAKDSQTGHFVKYVRPAWHVLDEDIQAALVEHVFRGNMILTNGPVTLNGYPPSRKVYIRMSVGFERYIAALVCKSWNQAFKEWVPHGIAGASARAFEITIREGIGYCQYTAYQWTEKLQARGIPYHPVHAWLPRVTVREMQLRVHGKLLATLTLKRRRADWNNPDTDNEDNSDKHELKVKIEAHKAPRMVLACMANAYESSRARRIRIPDECWTEEGLRGPVAEKFVCEQTVFLDDWVVKQYAELTRDWKADTRKRDYYWG